jgi:hypothetical protein
MSRLLNGESIFAIVSTTRYLLLVNLFNKEVMPIENNQHEYYGISWNRGDKYLTLSHSNIDNAALIDISAYASSEVGTISRGKIVTSPFLSQPHQIICAPDGRIVCTNTGRNAVSVIDINKPNHFQEVRISSERWDRLSGDSVRGDHLNSVFIKDEFLYVIAHGHQNGSVLATLSYPDLEVVVLDPIENRTGLHNIWVTNDGQKISCDSETGSLVELNSNEVLWESGSAVFTRGLAASPEFVLIGESQKTGRGSRHSSTSGLWLLDRETWGALDYFALGPYGAVHEVRLINIADEAHHGCIFDGLEMLQMRDLRRATAAEKIKESQQARQNRKAWTGFQLRYGSPSNARNHAKVAAPKDLCMITQTHCANESDRKLKFRYSLDGMHRNSHVSAVTYCGTGDDSNMHAILIQPVSEILAHLSLWTHDGNSWTAHPEIGIQGLPLAAQARIEVNLTHVEFHVDDALLLSLPIESLPMHSGALGIRWLDASVYPPDDVSVRSNPVAGSR